MSRTTNDPPRFSFRSFLRPSDSSGFLSKPAVTARILLTYFEGYSTFRTGLDSLGKSKPFFRQGFLDAFAHTGLSDDLLGRIAEVLYEDARCGFFHDGFFRSRV